MDFFEKKLAQHRKDSKRLQSCDNDHQAEKKRQRPVVGIRQVYRVRMDEKRGQDRKQERYTENSFIFNEIFQDFHERLQSACKIQNGIPV